MGQKQQIWQPCGPADTPSGRTAGGTPPPVQPPACRWPMQRVTQSCALGVQPVLLLFGGGDKSHRLHPGGGPGGLAVAAGGRWQCQEPPPCSPATRAERQLGARGCLPAGLQNPALFHPPAMPQQDEASRSDLQPSLGSDPPSKRRSQEGSTP